MLVVLVILVSAATARAWSDVHQGDVITDGPVAPGATAIADAQVPSGYRVIGPPSAVAGFSVADATMTGQRYEISITNNGGAAASYRSTVSYAASSAAAQVAQISDDQSLAGEGHPHGIDSGIAWYGAPTLSNKSPPISYTAVIGWGVIFVDDTGVSSTNARVEVASVETRQWDWTQKRWVLLWPSTPAITGWWKDEVSNDSDGNNQHIASDARVESDGYTSVTTGVGAGGGYCWHFWGTLSKILMPSVPGPVVTTIWARLFVPTGLSDDRAQSNWIIHAGIDFWIDTSCSPVDCVVKGASLGRFHYVPRDGSWGVTTSTTASKGFIEAHPLPISSPPL